jgi:hypothetical protein
MQHIFRSVSNMTLSLLIVRDWYVSLQIAFEIVYYWQLIMFLRFPEFLSLCLGFISGFGAGNMK